MYIYTIQIGLIFASEIHTKLSKKVLSKHVADKTTYNELKLIKNNMHGLKIKTILYIVRNLYNAKVVLHPQETAEIWLKKDAGQFENRLLLLTRSCRTSLEFV